MGTKNKITEENYKEVVLKRSIIICWVLLAICLVIKLFGGNFFGIVCTNDKFVKFCEYCDTSFIRYVIYFAYFILESTVMLLIIEPRIKIFSKKFLYYFICVFIFWIIKVLYDIEIIKAPVFISGLISLMVLYVLLLIFSKKPLMSLLIILYQTILGIIASHIKSISLLGTLSDSALFTFIFYIDYYIVFFLTLFYSIKIKIRKEKKKNGIN